MDLTCNKPNSNNSEPLFMLTQKLYNIICSTDINCHSTFFVVVLELNKGRRHELLLLLSKSGKIERKKKQYKCRNKPLAKQQPDRTNK